MLSWIKKFFTGKTKSKEKPQKPTLEDMKRQFYDEITRYANECKDFIKYRAKDRNEELEYINKIISYQNFFTNSLGDLETEAETKYYCCQIHTRIRKCINEFNEILASRNELGTVPKSGKQHSHDDFSPPI